jgi:hypothetical protein
MRKVRVTKDRLYPEKKKTKSIQSHKRGDRIVEKHRETERLYREK